MNIHLKDTPVYGNRDARNLAVYAFFIYKYGGIRVICPKYTLDPQT